MRVSEETSPLVIHLSSDDPYHNLSIEHYLLTRSHPDSRILLFYTNRPCLVIGRNQNPWLETDIKRLQGGLPSERQILEARRKASQTTPVVTPLGQSGYNARPVPIDLVRRRSGGGTVFHDSGNLNYSVIVPNSKSFKRSTHAEMVVRALSDHHEFRSSQLAFSEVRVSDRNDIVMRSHASTEWLKVSGSAYKLTKGRALHHGTLLYSSPYLDRISDLLRSPGRGLIQAKGVESVRSPVANIAWTADARVREETREEITEAIIREFWNLYGTGLSRQPGRNEVTLDPDEASIPEIAAGVEELMSDAWRFEQTPRFDFASGVLDGAEVQFQANRGVLEHLTVRSVDAPATGQDGGGGRLLELKKSDFSHQVKLHEVQSWRRLITSGAGDQDVAHKGQTNHLPDALVQRIEAIFPPSSTEGRE